MMMMVMITIVMRRMEMKIMKEEMVAMVAMTLIQETKRRRIKIRIRGGETATQTH